MAKTTKQQSNKTKQQNNKTTTTTTKQQQNNNNNNNKMVDPNKDKFIYGAIKLEEELDIHFPPMGPNFDVKCLSIRCHRAPPPSSSPLTPIKKKGLLSGKMKLSRSLSGGEKLPKDHVIVDVRLVIGPNKLRIPLHEEGNLDLKGEFKVRRGEGEGREGRVGGKGSDEGRGVERLIRRGISKRKLEGETEKRRGGGM